MNSEPITDLSQLQGREPAFYVAGIFLLSMVLAKYGIDVTMPTDIEPEAQFKFLSELSVELVRQGKIPLSEFM